MVNKKIKMNEKNADGTFNVLHPETTIEQVINPITGDSIVEHFVDTTKKHIEIVDEIPTNLEGKGVFFSRNGNGNGNAPNKPSVNITAESIGIVPNNSSRAQHNVTMLNNFLSANSEKSIVFGDNEYYFNDTIILTNSNALLGTHSTELLLTVTNKEFIDFNPMCRLENMRLSVPRGHDKIAIIIHNKDFMTPFWDHGFISSIRDIFIFAHAQTMATTGISIKSESDFNATGITIHNVYIMNCLTGIEIFNIGTGWSNGIFCEDIYLLGCRYGIRNTGDGNRFTFTFQFRMPEVAQDDKAIICGGSHNNFTGMIWDAPKNDYFITILFTSQSGYNVVSGMGFSVTYILTHIADYGRSNNIVTAENDYAYSPQIADNYSYDSDNNWIISRWTNFKGLYSNVLWNANKFATVNTNLGSGVLWYGNLDDFFTMNKVTISPVTASNPMVIEIILPTIYYGVPEMGITFNDGLIPKNVKIEYSSSLNGSYTTVIDTIDNRNSCVRSLISMIGANVAKMKITLSEGIYNAALNPNSVIGIGTIYMYSNNHMGNYYVNSRGGEIYGSINMNKNVINNKVWENGITANRPSNPVAFQEFFDTTLNKPIWRNATNSAWIDAIGNTV
ncbi:hypothetical protein NSQ62_07705 [Solibacillus sp. FSL H8-0523]|uniref:hypothetical protein n=1 Tax=Solibacillus sp. FSL H8-0523 TaxID=2954511 RepID=UPI0031010FA0